MKTIITKYYETYVKNCHDFKEPISLGDFFIDFTKFIITTHNRFSIEFKRFALALYTLHYTYSLSENLPFISQKDFDKFHLTDLIANFDKYLVSKKGKWLAPDKIEIYNNAISTLEYTNDNINPEKLDAKLKTNVAFHSKYTKFDSKSVLNNINLN